MAISTEKVLQEQTVTVRYPFRDFGACRAEEMQGLQG
jgi:hypothetical protein